MTTGDFCQKVARRLKIIVKILIFQYWRCCKYWILSDCQIKKGKSRGFHPVLCSGEGSIAFGKNVSIGVMQSPFFYSGYAYIDARNSCSKIQFGDDVWVNNSCTFISEGEGIFIGDRTLMGVNCEIIDSDFHPLDPDKRMSGGKSKTGPVTIGKNVFLGSNVKILKSVTIGDNSVIANSSVVVKSIPANVVAAGNPARVIRKLC